jgi:hypothetical protein
MPIADRKLKVFLCHAKDDKPIIRDFYRQLTSEGWMEVWLDEMKLLPGQDWRIEIEKAVEQADVVIVCLSKKSVEKEGYVQKELRFVINIADEKPEGTIFVVPLRLDDCVVPRRMNDLQYVDYFPKDNQAWAYRRLIESLKMRARKPGITIEDEKLKAEREQKAKEEKERIAAEKAEAERIVREKADIERKAQAERIRIVQSIIEEPKKEKASSTTNLLPIFAIGGIVVIALLCVVFGATYIINNFSASQIPTETSPKPNEIVTTQVPASLPVKVTTTDKSIAPGIWNTTGSMITPRDQFNMVVLDDGRILAAGGHNGSNGWLTSCEIYDPNTGEWSSTGSLHFPRIWYGHFVKLHDGRVLITGGANPAGSIDYASTEIFDPTTGQWMYSGDLNVARRGIDPIVLKDGRVLVAGGGHGIPNQSRYLYSSEIFDPSTDRWSYTGDLDIGIDGIKMVLLSDGRVVGVGGQIAYNPINLQTEIYSPDTETWLLGGDLPVYSESLIGLSDSRVLAIGGWNSDGNGIPNISLFNPATRSWTASTPMSVARISMSATMLPSGNVLITGGFPSFNQITAISESEIFNPNTGNLESAAPLGTGRYAPGYAVLNDGRTLVCGGGNNGQSLSTCEIYNPT